jgi:hypothetical protein
MLAIGFGKMDGARKGMLTNSKKRRPGDDIQAQTMRLIETARWHTVRYDDLRASLANRASFVVSVATILIAGTSFLFPWIADRKIYGGTTSLILKNLLSYTELMQPLKSSRLKPG